MEDQPPNPGLKCNKCGVRGLDMEPIPSPDGERFKCMDPVGCKNRRRWRDFAKKSRKKHGP